MTCHYCGNPVRADADGLVRTDLIPEDPQPQSRWGGVSYKVVAVCGACEALKIQRGGLGCGSVK